jgi:hypothetical protein
MRNGLFSMPSIFREAIIREWDGMAQDFIKKLMDSMPKRVA